MREWCGTAVEVSDQAQQERTGRRRSTLSACRRVAVLTLTLVLVACVHVAWAPDACAAPAELVEQRITLNGLDADLTLERDEAQYLISIRFIEESPDRIDLKIRQVIDDFQDGDLISTIGTTWSDNVTMGDGYAVFTPTEIGDQAVFDFGHTSLSHLQRLEISFESTEPESILLELLVSDSWGDQHVARSPRRPVAGNAVVVQRLERGSLIFVPGESPNEITSLNQLKVSSGSLRPILIHSLEMTRSLSVRRDGDGFFRFSVPVSPAVSFEVTSGDDVSAFALDDYVGSITVDDTPAIGYRKRISRADRYNLDSMQFVTINEEHFASGDFVKRIAEAGWDGVSLDYHMFVDSLDASYVFKLYSPDISVTGSSLFTPHPSSLERVLDLITSTTNLLVNLRVQLFLNREKGYRGELTPSNLSAFFDSFYNELLEPIQIANRYGVSIFTPFVELDSLYEHTTHIHRLLDRLDPYFDGWFGTSISTHGYVRGGWWYNDGKQIEDSHWRFLDWQDSDGRRLIIGPNIIVSELSRTTSYTRESLLAYMLDSWRGIIDFYRTRFPHSIIWFGELASSQRRGAVLGEQSRQYNRGEIDHTYREMADCLHTMITGSRLLGLDGFNLLSYPTRTAWYHHVIPDEIKPDIEALLE